MTAFSIYIMMLTLQMHVCTLTVMHVQSDKISFIQKISTVKVGKLVSFIHDIQMKCMDSMWCVYGTYMHNVV